MYELFLKLQWYIWFLYYADYLFRTTILKCFTENRGKIKDSVIKKINSRINPNLLYTNPMQICKSVLKLSIALFSLWHPDTFMPNAIASKNPRKQSISHRSLLR